MTDRAQTGGVVAFVAHGSVDGNPSEVDRHLMHVDVYPRSEVRGVDVVSQHLDEDEGYSTPIVLKLKILLVGEDDPHVIHLQILGDRHAVDDATYRRMVADLTCGEFDGDVVWVGRARSDNSRRDWARRENSRVARGDLEPSRRAP